MQEKHRTEDNDQEVLVLVSEEAAAREIFKAKADAAARNSLMHMQQDDYPDDARESGLTSMSPEKLQWVKNEYLPSVTKRLVGTLASCSKTYK